MSKFKQYQVFSAVYESGSISQAAKALVSTPSAISKQLVKLEEAIGVNLFQRSGNALLPTAIAQEFYNEVTQILSQVESAEQRLRQERESLSGNLRLSVPSIFLESPLLAVLNEFSALHPEITYSLDVSNEVFDLIDKNIDFAFRVGQMEDSRLTSFQLGKLSFSFYASPDYLAANPDIKFTRLLDERHVIIPTSIQQAGVAKLSSVIDGGKIKDLRLYHSTNDALSLLPMAEAGLGVVQSFDITAERYIQAGSLVKLFPDKRSPSIAANLVYRNHGFMPEYKLVFKEFIKRRYPELLCVT